MLFARSAEGSRYDEPVKCIASKEGRLDALIAACDVGLSRSKIQQAIKEGLVTVNGTVVTKPAQQLSEGDSIVLDTGTQQLTTHTAITPVHQHLDVLYEDDACMVLNKPAGIAVHPGHAMDPSEHTMLSGIAYLFVERSIPFSPDSVLVHRLDKPTTGCLIIAKNQSSFAELQKQFEERSTEKKYIAIVSGVPEHTEATIDAPIGRNLTDRTKMSILKTSTSRDAKTSYRVLDHTSDCSLIACNLHTGRTHQIRVHLFSIGHPILGDETYNSTFSKNISNHYASQGLCLHARSIAFTSPHDKKRHIVNAPFSATIKALADVAALSLPTD